MMVPDSVFYTLLTGGIGAAVGAIFKAHKIGTKVEDFIVQTIARSDKIEARQDKHDSIIGTMQITAERTSTQLESVRESLKRIEDAVGRMSDRSHQ